MKGKLSNLSQIEFNIFIDDVNKHIFNGDLTEIIEVTYAYKKISDSLYYNTTLFSAYGGCKYSKKIDLDIVKFIVEKKLQNTLSQLEFYILKSEIVFSRTKEDKIRHKFLKKQLLYVQNSILIALNGLPFELEKAGYKHNLSKIEISQYVKNIRISEKANFGGKIIYHKQEVILCYEFLKRKEKSLSIEKQESLGYYLKKIEAYLPLDYVYVKKIQKRKKQFHNIFKTQITREDYMAIFDKVFELNKLPQRSKVTNVGSIYDGEIYLEIPQKKSYEKKTIHSVLKLIGHEIMAHTINLENTKNRLGNFRGAHNLDKEEGLAMLFEQLFDGIKLEDIGIIGSFSTILIGEICTAKEFKSYLSIFFSDPEKTFLRLKRNYPKNKKGVQHKDTAYSRGILKTKKFILDGGNIEDLFLGKVSFDEIKYLKKLEFIGKKQSDISPLYISELLYYMIHGFVKGSENICISDFIEYLSNKYPFISTDKLAVEYRKKYIKNNIYSILEILDKYIPGLSGIYLK